MKNLLLLFAIITIQITIFSQGDSPCTASTLTVSTSCSYTAGTTVGSTYSNDFAHFGTPSCASPGSGDVWYRITAPTNGSITIAMTDGTISDSGMALYSATNCSTGGTSIACDDDGGPDNMSQITQTGLTSGAIYYVRLWKFSSGTGTFNICITTPNSPSNDNCSGAISLTSNASCSTTSGTTLDATQSLAGCSGTANDDVWYSFTATSTMHAVTVVGSASFDPVFEVFSGTCAGTSISCTNNNFTSGGTETSTLTGLTIGNTYWLRVYDYYSGVPTTSTFTICIVTITPPANNECAGAILLTSSTNCSSTSGTVANASQSLAACTGTANDDVWYQFVATSTSHSITVTGSASFDPSFELFSGTCAGTSILCIDEDYSDGGTETSTATGLTIGNTYWVRVYDYGSDVPATTTFDICIVTVTPPANDECAGAIDVAINTGTTCTLQTAGTVVGATASSNPIGTCGGTANDDVWYKFTATHTALSININNVNGSTTDLYHAVYIGTCGALTNIICSDPDGSSLTALTIGNVYYLRVYTYTPTAFQTTTFDICILPTPPPPSNITCNTMTPICSGTPIVFTAQSTGVSAASGPNYGCLSTTPNPTWFYLEIDNPGLLSIDMSSGTDIDFAIWGPYTNLANAKADCGSYPAPLDCSYSTSATEQANVAATTTGQFYVLLVTNYANVIQIININQGQSAIATTNCATLLPVEMSRYDIQLKDKKVHVNWVTDSEQNNDYFAVQRSENGNLWETIGVRKGKGNSTVQNSYQLIDEKPLASISYYRLKQVDLDGKYTYSPLRSINNTPQVNFSLFPIPTKDQVTIISKNEKIDHIQVTDLIGNQIDVLQTIIEGGYVLDLSELKIGIYTVTITIGEKREKRKLIKA